MTSIEENESGWTTVHHMRRRRRRTQNRTRQMQAEAEAELQHDPVYVWKKAQVDYQITWVRRIRRNPVYAAKLALEKTYDGYQGPKRWCPGCEQSMPTFTFAGAICQNCASLPIPHFDNINAEPIIFRKRYQEDDELNSTDPDESANSANFAKRVVAARVAMNLTQEELATLVSRKVAVIRDFEAGKLRADPALKSQLIWRLQLEN